MYTCTATEPEPARTQESTKLSQLWIITSYYTGVFDEHIIEKIRKRKEVGVYVFVCVRIRCPRRTRHLHTHYRHANQCRPRRVEGRVEARVEVGPIHNDRVSPRDSHVASIAAASRWSILDIKSVPKRPALGDLQRTLLSRPWTRITGNGESRTGGRMSISLRRMSTLCQQAPWAITHMFNRLAL